jgi:hypothetical protein
MTGLWFSKVSRICEVAFSMPFIKKGSCRSSKLGLKKVLAFSKVSTPLLMRSSAMGKLTPIAF